MKLHFTKTSTTQEGQDIDVPAGAKSEINLLILLHTVFFILYSVIRWMEFPEASTTGATISDFIQTNLVISMKTDDLSFSFWGSIFTYQFIHTNFLAFVFNMAMLWIFGHILKKQIGERDVVLLYMVCAILSAIVFVLSHFVFNVFSGSVTMEGPLGGVLGVMAATVVYYKSSNLYVLQKPIPFWKVYVGLMACCFLLFYQNSIAYILVFICSTYAGGRYAAWQNRLFRPVRED